MTPSIAAAGDTVTLEGTFSGTAMVQFPGGAVQPATVLGEHRATVVVPDAATAGDLSVTTGDVTIGPVFFRRTSFALGLQPFRVSYEQVDGARQSPNLRIARSAAASAVLGKWLYILGGAGSAGAVNSVERAAINADGTVGVFDIVDGATLLEARSGHTAAVIGSTLYVIGGSGTSGAVGSVERATVGADGSLGSLSTVAGVALAMPRTGHASAVIGNTIYVIGGARSDGAKLGTIERAVIQADGSLGTFATVAPALVIARSDLTVEVVGNALYVIGGETSSALPTGTIERATIGGDGSLGTFEIASNTALVAARSGHRTAVIGGAVYALGRATGTDVTASIERAPIGSDGSVGMFTLATTTVLSALRTTHSIAVIDNSLYVIGGHGEAGPLSSVERGSIDIDSAVGAFADSTTALIAPRTHPTTTAVGSAVYVIGQSGSSNTIESAAVHSDGSFGSFATVPGLSLVTSRTEHAAAVVGHFLYIIGGATPTTVGSIERAQIHPDGTLGTFAAVSAELVEPRFGHACFVVGHFLYVIGGIGVSHNRLTSVERAMINDDGSLSAFATVAGVSLNTGRNFFTVLVTDSSVYAIGGVDDATGGTASIERAAIALDGSLGTFSSVANLLAGRGAHASAVIGNAIYIIGGLISGQFVDEVEQTTIAADGTLNAFIGLSANQLTDLRARHTAVALSDHLYLIGGETMLPGGQINVVVDLEDAPLR